MFKINQHTLSELMFMKIRHPLIFAIFCLLANTCLAQSNNLKLVFIRHAERPDNGDNLNCQGLNRSMLLPSVLVKKFGNPSAIYVPSLKLGEGTKRARMFQTATPLAVKYGLSINAAYGETDYKQIGKALLKESGTVVIVWEHKAIKHIIKYLGAGSGSMDWPGSDFDSIWVVTFPNGHATLTRDRENIHPASGCAF